MDTASAIVLALVLVSLAVLFVCSRLLKTEKYKYSRAVHIIGLSAWGLMILTIAFVMIANMISKQ